MNILLKHFSDPPGVAHAAFQQKVSEVNLKRLLTIASVVVAFQCVFVLPYDVIYWESWRTSGYYLNLAADLLSLLLFSACLFIGYTYQRKKVPYARVKGLIYFTAVASLLFTLLFTVASLLEGGSGLIFLLCHGVALASLQWSFKEGLSLLAWGNLLFCVAMVVSGLPENVYVGLLINQCLFSLLFFLISRNGFLVIYREFESQVELERIKNEAVAARYQAEKASMEKADFLSTMSHEIRTPLNGVIGLTYLLLEESPTPRQREYLVALKTSAENLLYLINDILDFNKIEAGKAVLEAVDFSLPSLVRDLDYSFRFRAMEKGIRFAVELDPKLPQVLVGDPGKLSQVLANLLSNAIKFTQEGQVSFSVKGMENVPVHEGTVAIQFVVEDTGIGISAENQALIFESYRQATPHISRHFGGTGLGLSITQKLVALMGSRVEFVSEPGKGSRFSFALNVPVSRQQNATESPYTFGKGFGFDLQGVRILLAEDNHLNMQITGRLLSKWGAEVDLAHNGLLALEKIQQHAYHLVLMDLQMPGMDGYQTARAIRAMPGLLYQQLPIIAFTASSAAEVKESILAAGMNDVFTKPLNPVDLYHKIAERTLPFSTCLGSESRATEKVVSEEAGLVNLEPYREIAAGDPEFYRELLAKTHELLSDFWTAYQQSMYEADEVALRKELHKVRSTLLRLEMNQLLALLTTDAGGRNADNARHLEWVGQAIGEVQSAIQQALSASRLTHS
jgi:signal transduction histidine kinase/response regulator RpfG family c-di-GMP phosphodiesterase